MAKQEKIFTHEHDKNLLSALHTADLIDRRSQTIRIHDTINHLQNIIRTGNTNIFAILDENSQLKGVITLDDIRPVLFNKGLEATYSVQQLMKAPVAIVQPWQLLPKIIEIFDDTGVWHLPVVNDNSHFIGFISKSAILNSYRQLLKEYSAG